MKEKKFKIGNRWVGEGEPCFIIAEAGSNHDRSFRQARRLITVAAKAKADAVKFQLFKGKELSADKKTQRLLKKFEFQRKWLKKLIRYAEINNIMFFATPFDFEAVDLLHRNNVSAFKISSGDLTNIPLICYIAKKLKPIILSVGLGTLDEIAEALEAVYSTGNKKIALLHCIVQYPADPEEVDLNAIKILRRKFRVPVGFSDHTLGISIPIGAAALGSNIIEKHFTLDKRLKGPDHIYALAPQELIDMVKGVRDIEKALDIGLKHPAAAEKNPIIYARRSIYAKVDILKGTVISDDMLSVLRPAIGIAPKHIYEIRGKRAKRDVAANEPITWDKI